MNAFVTTLSAQRVVDDAAVKPFAVTADRLIKERREQLATSEMRPLKALLQHERRPETLLPAQYDRVMYALYFYPRNVEGVFRVNSGKVETDEYMRFLPLLDLRNADHVLLGGLLKKYLRETEQPVWPESLYDPLIRATADHATSLPRWKVKARQLIASLPAPNKVFLTSLVALCLRMAQNETSRMTLDAIAQCLGPAVIRKNAAGPAEVARDLPHVFKAFFLMLVHASAASSSAGPLTASRSPRSAR